jgi:hypothetical protein
MDGNCQWLFFGNGMRGMEGYDVVGTFGPQLIWYKKVADEIDWISPQAHPSALLYVFRRTICFKA